MGTITVLLACVAAQIPWFTCHSDCQATSRPLWDLTAHRCHVAATPERTPTRGCGCSCHHHATPERAVDDDGHGPADHSIVSALSPQPAAPVTFDAEANLLLAVAPALDDGPASLHDVYAVRPALARSTAGPPPGLASVRLLL